jgi:hypothetical protein
MTERSLEVAVAQEWLRGRKNVFEIGAVTSYYFPGAATDVCDPYDEHPDVNMKNSIFDYDLTGRDVLTISTLEHIGTGDCNLEIKRGETGPAAVEKIAKEASAFMITFPVGYNAELDEYFASGEHEKLGDKFRAVLYARNTQDNKWTEISDMSEIRAYDYGPHTANAVVFFYKD